VNPVVVVFGKGLANLSSTSMPNIQLQSYLEAPEHAV